MLKPFYAAEAEVPENLKGAYKAQNGRYELIELDSTHPVLTKNRELLERNSMLTGENQRLNAETVRLEGRALPEGRIAVDKAQFDAQRNELDTLKTQNAAYAALGPVEDIRPRLESYDGLAEQAMQAIRDRALMAAGITDLDRARDFKAYDDLRIETERVEGKDVFRRVVLDAEGKDARVPFDAEALKADTFASNLGSLIGSGGHQHFRQATGGSSQQPKDMAASHMANRYKGVPEIRSQ